jgi:hypothetical protein
MELFRSTEDLERRRAPRCEPDGAVTCAIRDPRTGSWHPAAIRDISLTGLALLSDQEFEAGQILTVELRQEKRGITRKYLVEVRHADICCPNDAYLFGCRFARFLRDDELALWL